ncbi:protein LNK2-like isoform X1 [Senna tora]|uniref:Protein LNK2-like isoform X1 n=1 Tax=Senna tora TaxID=362788 RepID=A0A834TMS0_9FABA|nr:protein LNK2-like isoform X1 [Senna tora]
MKWQNLFICCGLSSALTKLHFVSNELANIIWGEAGVSDDHIVPFPEVSADLGNKKEWNQGAANIKLTEQKRPEVKIDVHCRNLGSTSNLDNSGGVSASGYGTNTWPNLSLSSAVKNDQGSLVWVSVYICVHMQTLVCLCLLEETAQLGKDAEVFQNAHDGKEQGDFVDYGWGNIGSFDDLDRIFSNDDPIFSHVNLDNAGELWSSKDVSNSPAPISLDTPSPAGALRNRSEPLENKANYIQCNDQLFALSCGKIGGPASNYMQNAHAVTADVKHDVGRSKPAGKEHQAFGQNTLLKVQKKPQGKQEGKVLHDVYGGWSPSTNLSGQFENQLAPSAIKSSPSVLGNQKHQLQGAETFYQNIMNPYVASPVYGNLANSYSAIPMLSQAQSGDLRHQPMLSGYEVSSGIVNPVKKSGDSVKPMTMTPQEKIEKLRRRQQMQAMLAIQKQQQQLGHQVPGTNKCITQNCLLEIQNRSYDGVNPEVEDLSTFSALDASVEQDDSNTISVDMDVCFVEETVLYRLQDIISKLDIKIRLSIRDSLFRLAQSAMQRHYASDTSSTNKSTREELDAVAREEINYQNRDESIVSVVFADNARSVINLVYDRMHDVETETNPIDRTVAHLLFHRPLELTGNYPDKLDSPISAKMQIKRKSNPLNLTSRCLPDEDLKSNQQFSRQRLQNSCSLFEAQPMDQFQNSPCLDTSENASNNGPGNVGAQELEASQ